MQYTSAFVTVNNIRLHYLDWGGPGPNLIFLTGMGSSAYILSHFAGLFADRYRVLVLTRRGHGDSDYPADGYDAPTLANDIVQFMDALQIDTASLAGHSIAGVELTQLAASYPHRINKLIYLDALDDRRGFDAIQAQSPLKGLALPSQPSEPRTLAEYTAAIRQAVPEFAVVWSDVWDEEFAHGTTVNSDGLLVDRMPAAIDQQLVDNLITNFAPPPVAAAIPILAFFALGTPARSDAYSAEQKAAFDHFWQTVRVPFVRTVIANFQHRFPQAHVIELPKGHHYCFMAQEALVYQAMRNFLAA